MPERRWAVQQEIGPTCLEVPNMKIWNAEFLKSNSTCMISEHENFGSNTIIDLNLELLLQLMLLHPLIHQYPPMEAPPSPPVFILIRVWIHGTVNTHPNQEPKHINKIRKWTTE